MIRVGIIAEKNSILILRCISVLLVFLLNKKCWSSVP